MERRALEIILDQLQDLNKSAELAHKFNDSQLIKFEQQGNMLLGKVELTKQLGIISRTDATSIEKEINFTMKITKERKEEQKHGKKNYNSSKLQ